MAKIKVDKDMDNHGRKEYFVDIDRMVSEGLAGGTVEYKYDDMQIEKATEIGKEEPPSRAFSSSKE
jgi:hypothetical protein